MCVCMYTLNSKPLQAKNTNRERATPVESNLRGGGVEQTLRVAPQATREEEVLIVCLEFVSNN